MSRRIHTNGGRWIALAGMIAASISTMRTRRKSYAIAGDAYIGCATDTNPAWGTHCSIAAHLYGSKF